jgi:hypothetical protein
MSNNNRARWYWIALGILLTPILFFIFIMDRFLMVFLVMGNGPDIVEYYQDIKYIGMSILRVTVVTIVSLICMWIW